MIRNRK